jgi:hypothetical protein
MLILIIKYTELIQYLNLDLILGAKKQDADEFLLI